MWSKSKVAIFAIKMEKMTQIGQQKLAKINFWHYLTFHRTDLRFFSFFTILWPKMTQILAKKI